MALPNMIAAGNLKEVLGDILSNELVETALSRARVLFKSNIATDSLVEWDGSLYRVGDVTARVDSNGDLVNEDGGPLRLLANDDDLSIHDLQWQVHIELPGTIIPPTAYGKLRAYWFTAGVDGETIDLATVTPVPSVGSVGGTTRGAKGDSLDELERDGNEIVGSVNGVEVGRIDISDLIFNGDMDDITDATVLGKALARAVSAAAARATLGVTGVLNILDPVYGVAIGSGSSQTSAIKAALDANPGAAFFFPPGDYRLNTKLTISKSNSLILAAGARIYAAAAMDTLIDYDNGEASVDDYAQDHCIIGHGMLDANLNADVALRINRVIRFDLGDSLTIKNPINRGIFTGSLGAEIYGQHIRILNTGTTNVTDNVGIEANMNDCVFSNIVMRDMTIGVWDKGANTYIDIHPWLGDTAQLTARYQNSVAFKLAGDSLLIAPYADTYRYSFQSALTAPAFATARIVAPKIFCNSSNLTNTLAASYPGVVFYSTDGGGLLIVSSGVFKGHPVTAHAFTSGPAERLRIRDSIDEGGITDLPSINGPLLESTVFQPGLVLSDSFTASNGTALDSGKWTVADGGAAAADVTTNGNRGRFTSGATGSYSATDRAYAESTAWPLIDAEILALHEFGAVANESYQRYAVRASNADPQAGNNYVATLYSGGIIIGKTVAGTPTDIAADSYTDWGLAAAANGGKKWIRHRARGSTISLKVWDYGTDEPVGWMYTITDTSVTAAGSVTVGISGGSAAASGINYVDQFHIYAL